MKKTLLLFVGMFIFFLSCKSTSEANKPVGVAISNDLGGDWVLDEVGGRKAEDKDFLNGIPKININAASSTFTGTAGCNSFGGNLFSKEKNGLHFLNISVTKVKKCSTKSREGDYLKLLKSNLKYDVDGDKLKLSNQFGMSLVLKKV